jgi:hypothetical protein
VLSPAAEFRRQSALFRKIARLLNSRKAVPDERVRGTMGLRTYHSPAGT